ncbi:MAG: glycosyltransferase [Candidatus Omnitrophota bacterium]
MKERKKEKILIVTSTFPGNREDPVTTRFVFDHAVALGDFYNVYVLAPHSPGAALSEEISGIKVRRFRYFFPTKLEKLTTGEGILANIRKNKLLVLLVPLLFLSEILSVRRLVRKEGISVVNSHWIVPQGLAVALLKNTLKVRHVCTVHAAGIFALKRWGGAGKKLSRFIIRRTDIVVPVSAYIKLTIDGVAGVGYNYKIIPMGFDSRRFAAQAGEGPALRRENSRDKLRLLFVGRIVEKKGLNYLLDAMRILKDKELDVSLAVAGGGPLEDRMKSYASSSGVKDEVDFLGWTHNEKVPELLRSADITVVPSIVDSKGETEGMPVVVLESMAMGRPVLASRISGIPDIVKDGVNGWLVEPASAIALAEKIEEICKSDLERYSKSAKEISLKYAYKEVSLEYKRIIDDLYRQEGES